VSRYRLTKKAERDLAALFEFSSQRFGRERALQFLDQLEQRLLALASHEYEGPELVIAARAKPVRRWPIPPYWIYYDRIGGSLRVLRIYHGAQKPL
jgi:plasmid stabilization system protein ParE